MRTVHNGAPLGSTNMFHADLGRVRRQLEWKSGSLELVHIQCDEPTEFRHSYPASGALLMLGGYTETFNRRLDGRAAPRPPSRGGEISFFPAGTTLSAVAKGWLQFLRIYFQPEFLQQVIGESHLHGHLHAPIVNWTDVICSTLAHELERDIITTTHDVLFVETAVALIALQLARFDRELPDRLPNGARLSEQHRRLIEDYIEANLQRNFTLTELADHIGLSLTHFCRLFRRTTGCSPYRFAIVRRVERARKLLRETTLPITDIALTVGFNSQSHLTTQFRRTVGIAPARYRSEVSTVRLTRT